MALPKKLLDLLKQKNARLEDVPLEVIALMEKALGGIFDNMVAVAGQLNLTKTGEIAMTAENLRLMEKIADDLTVALESSPEYLKALRHFALEMDKQGVINNNFFKEAIEGFKPSDFMVALAESNKLKAVEFLIGTPAKESFLRPVQNILETAIGSGASFADTVKSMREWVLGDEERDSRLLSYAKQITHDNFALNDRMYSKAAADEADAEWFLYSGGLIATSREFCKQRSEQYFHREEIMLFGEGLDLNGNPLSDDELKGRMDGTNAETIFATAGGHWCGHSIMMVSVFAVPPEVIKRNIAAGRYSPSEKERELVGV